MTNKVKPFYIRITDDMTPQMVQDAFDKCHSLGVKASDNDDVENISNWDYFGVCSWDGTYLSKSKDGYICAQEITLDQLDEWLGLGLEQEWSGEGLPPVGVECEFKESKPMNQSCFSDWSRCKILAYNTPTESRDEAQVIIRDDNGDAAIIYSSNSPSFRPIETPEQKVERERDEAINMICGAIDNFSSESKNWAGMLYDAGCVVK